MLIGTKGSDPDSPLPQTATGRALPSGREVTTPLQASVLRVLTRARGNYDGDDEGRRDGRG